MVLGEPSHNAARLVREPRRQRKTRILASSGYVEFMLDHSWAAPLRMSPNYRRGYGDRSRKNQAQSGQCRFLRRADYQTHTTRLERSLRYVIVTSEFEKCFPDLELLTSSWFEWYFPTSDPSKISPLLSHRPLHRTLMVYKHEPSIHPQRCSARRRSRTMPT